MKTQGSKRELDYLAILLQDVGYTSLAQRNGYLSRIAGKEIKFLDELTPGQVSGLINTLKEQKERGRVTGEDTDVDSTT